MVKNAQNSRNKLSLIKRVGRGVYTVLIFVGANNVPGLRSSICRQLAVDSLRVALSYDIHRINNEHSTFICREFEHSMSHLDD